jgi:hypothetical protein
LRPARIGWNKHPCEKGAFQPMAKLRRHKNQIQQRRNRMGVVMIKCPGTGRAIPTGMKSERNRFRSSPVFFARTFCSICQTNHEWFAREAWVHEPEEEWRMSGPAFALSA